MRTFRLKYRYLLPAIVIAGLALSIVAFLAAYNGERFKIRDEFERSAENSFAALKREIESDLQALVSISAAYTAFHGQKRHEFADLVRPILAQHPGIQALEWIPLVPDSRRSAYEAAARRDGFPGFQITERLKQGTMVRAGRRPEYFPVYFVEPYQGNKIALGFDLASNAARREALEHSRETGKIVATARITLVQETAGQFGLIVFNPVYRKHGTFVSRRVSYNELEGFSLGVFRIGDIVEKSIATSTSKASISGFSTSPHRGKSSSSIIIRQRRTAQHPRPVKSRRIATRR